MRIVALLPCLLLTACLGQQAEPDFPSAAVPQASDAAIVAGSPRPSGARSGGSAAGGGATTSAARAAPSSAPEDQRDPLTQARVDCWMKVEHEKGVRDIDRRIAFVDKCVANAMKGKP
jgi:hypothetical protein